MANVTGGNRRLGLLLAAALLVTAAAQADFPAPRETKTGKPYGPVSLATLVFDQPRPLRAWVVRIELASPDIDFVVTPRGPFRDKYETAAATTLAFAEQAGVQVAINASPFDPIRDKAGEGVDVQGLDLSDGDVVSPPADGLAALVLDARHQARLLAPPVKPADLKDAVAGVGGFTLVLAGGRNLYAKEAEPGAKAPRHPRTAAGLTADRKTLVWLVVDGRQPGQSEGLTLFELAELGRQAGCAELLNLDGGGSTTLVLQDPDSRKHRVVNTPVGRGNQPGTLRFNGNALGLQVFTPDRNLTAAQLRAVMPHLPAERVGEFLGPLNRVMTRYGITTPLRRAAFLAQLAHESGELRYMEELASGDAYQGRKDLGNTQPGDGVRYKGRGLIQLTGRFNYRGAGQALGLDLEGQPELAARPAVGCRVAGWFWDTHGLNGPADRGDFEAITRTINGGLRGQPQREAYYRKALEVLKAG